MYLAEFLGEFEILWRYSVFLPFGREGSSRLFLMKMGVEANMIQRIRRVVLRTVLVNRSGYHE